MLLITLSYTAAMPLDFLATETFTDTFPSEVFIRSTEYDAAPKIAADSPERFQGETQEFDHKMTFFQEEAVDGKAHAQETFQDEGFDNEFSAPKGNPLPEVEAVKKPAEEALSSPETPAEPAVDQFSEEETELDHKLHVFQELVKHHIDNNHAVCKDPKLVQEDQDWDNLGSHPNAFGPKASTGVDNITGQMEIAVQTVRKSAEKGDSRAQFSLAFALEKGIGVYKDPAQALQWYKTAAAQEYPPAIINLGVMYLRGADVERNEVAAADYFQQAANLGNVYAMHILGALYRDGVGVPMDLEKAITMFEKSAKFGNSHAAFSLGKLSADMTENRKAVYWYKKAALRGDAAAEANLGVHYMTGRGVEKNPEAAAQWFLKAAEQGNDFAQLNIGVSYLYGRGVGKDATKAAHWFLKSAEQGLKQAQFNIGILYRKGLGVEQDAAQGAYWIAKAKEYSEKQ